MRFQFNIGGINYPSLNSTNGVALDIFFSGCGRKDKCSGCHNPELWDFKAGIVMSLDDIKKVINKKYADSVAIMGGEPLHIKNIEQVLAMIKKAGKKIWFYTSYELSDIPESIKQYCDFIKTGKFEMDKKIDGRLSSLNQKIYEKRGTYFALYYADGKELSKVSYGETSII